MQLPDDLRTRLATEYRTAVDRMRDSDDPFGQIYYFSVFFGEASRVLNWHWDRDLALINLVTQGTQRAVSQRLQTIVSNTERVVQLSEEFFDAFSQAASDLTDYVEQDGDPEELRAVLGRMAELSYVTTGNGYYLLDKGQISL